MAQIAEKDMHNISTLTLWLTLALLCVVQLCTSMDNAVLGNATSTLVKDFNSSIAMIQITNTIYPLTAGAFMIISGLLGMVIGWNILLSAGLFILTIGEIIACLSPNILVFTYIARFCIGVGASASIPAVLAIITSMYKNKHQAIAFSAIAATNGFATAFGPIVGGFVIVYWSWRIAFLLLAVFFCIAFICSLLIPKLPKHIKIPGFDLPGSILITISLALFCFGILQINHWGLLKPHHINIMGFSPCLPLIIIGILLFLLLLSIEKRRETMKLTTVLPSILLNTPQVNAGIYMTGLIFFVLGGLAFLLVTFVQIVMGYNAIHTGILLLPLASGILIFSLGVSCLLKVQYPQLVCRLGICTAAISCYIIGVGIQQTSISAHLLFGLFTIGVGLGLIASQANIAITFAIPKEYAEQSAGIQGAIRNIGQAIGVTSVGLVLIITLSSTIKTKLSMDHELTLDTQNKISVADNITFLSDERTMEVLEKMKIPEEQRINLIKINAISRLIAIRVSLSFLAFILLIAMTKTCKLPRKLRISA